MGRLRETISLRLLSTLTTALALASSALAGGPTGLTEGELGVYHEGVDLLKHNRFAAAAEKFSSLIESHPYLIEAFEQRAEAYRGLENDAVTPVERDRYALKRIGDEGNAANIKATREIAADVEIHSSRVLAAALLQVGCWLVCAILWIKKGYSVVSPWFLLAFFFCGPIALLLMVTSASGSLDSSETGDGIREHPADVSSVADDVSRTQACPNCGRVNSINSRICPRCETRLI